MTTSSCSCFLFYPTIGQYRQNLIKKKKTYFHTHCTIRSHSSYPLCGNIYPSFEKLSAKKMLTETVQCVQNALFHPLPELLHATS